MSSTTPITAGTTPATVVAPMSPQLMAAHERVALFTQQIFGRAATVLREQDPEEGSELFRVRVAAVGTGAELKEKFRRWHHELPAAAGEFSDLYALSPSLVISE